MLKQFGEEALDRYRELTKYVTKEKIGIEIGPWFSPIAPKCDGYQCLALDIFDFETLKEKAKVDLFILNHVDEKRRVNRLNFNQWVLLSRN